MKESERFSSYNDYQAYKRGLVSPKYMFITYGWYGERWWGEGAISSDYNCTSEDLATVALYGVAAVLAEFPDEPDAIAESNIVSCGEMNQSVFYF